MHTTEATNRSHDATRLARVASERSERATGAERGRGVPASDGAGGSGGAKPPGKKVTRARVGARAHLCALLVAAFQVATGAQPDRPRGFATPEEAVRALVDAAKQGNLDLMLAIFGPDGRELAATSDPATARMNLKVFTVAAKERMRLDDAGPNRKTLVIGNEDWPFPVPLVKAADGWRFDTAAGKNEILARRIGRNELAVIDTCRAYVTAQRRYAQRGHDGKPAGLYAMTFASDPGKQNGLYWAAAKGQKLSPLGEMVAQAAEDVRPVNAAGSRQPSPFQGYYFRILRSQGPAAAGGARNYIVNGVMSGGFALVAWPVQYAATGVMTFMVNQDGIVFEKDLGSGTGAVAEKVTTYDPDKTWQPIR